MAVDSLVPCFAARKSPSTSRLIVPSHYTLSVSSPPFHFFFSFFSSHGDQDSFRSPDNLAQQKLLSSLEVVPSVPSPPLPSSRRPLFFHFHIYHDPPPPHTHPHSCRRIQMRTFTTRLVSRKAFLSALPRYLFLLTFLIGCLIVSPLMIRLETGRRYFRRKNSSISCNAIR